MSDDRMNGELRDALLRDDPGPLPETLRRRIDGVPDEIAARRWPVRLPRASRLSAAVEAIAAVLVVAAIIGTALYVRGSGAGSGASHESPSGPVPSGQPVVSPTYFPTGNPPSSPDGTPALPPPVVMWTGLNWSAAGSIQGAAAVDDMIWWNGRLIAATNPDAGGGIHEARFWSSPDGISWTELNVNRAAFSGGGRVERLAVGPLGLIAWGYIGQPACTGQGEGMTCDPTPVMIWTSPDGTTWTRVADVAMYKNATIQNIAVGAHGLVAAGDTGWTQPAVWTSINGQVWQRQKLNSTVFANAHFSDVRAMASGYVLAGATGGKAPVCCIAPGPSGSAAGWWSPDGQNWTKATVGRTGGGGTMLGTIHVGADGMVAVGEAGAGATASAAWKSSDGRTWQSIAVASFAVPPATSDTTTVPSNAISDDGTRMLAFSVDQSGLLLWTSTDGVAWGRLDMSGTTALNASTLAGAYVLEDGVEVLAQENKPTGPISTWKLTARP